MKLAIIGDPHFGHSMNCGHINPKTDLHTRLEDFCATFDQVVDYCESNEVDLLIVLGDIYRNNHPTMVQQREFAKRLRRLQVLKQETLIIKGNHDMVISANAAHSIAPFQELQMLRTTILDEPSLFQLKDLSVICMPYLHKAKLGFRNNDQLLEHYREKVDELYARAGEHKIFIGHQTPEGAIPPQHQIDLSTTDEFIVPLEILRKFDAAFFGHIHRIQELSKQPPIWVCGSMDRIDFAEAREEKRLFLYDTEEKIVSSHPLQVRDFVPIKIDLRGIESEEIGATILEAIDKKDTKDAVVKVVIQVEEASRGFINHKEIQHALKDAQHVLDSQLKVERATRSRNEKVNEELDSVDALKEYLSGKHGLSDRLKKKILTRGIQTIKYCDSGAIL